MTEFNPSNKNHGKLLNQIKEVVSTGKWTPTPTLLDEIHPFKPLEGETWSKNYTRTMIGRALNYMREENRVEMDTEKTQGQPTKLWKLKK